MLWGVGDALTLDGGGIWNDLADGYAVAGPVDAHEAYQKRQSWFSTVEVEDLSGRVWQAPRIIDASGERVFRVAYGRDFLPELTAEQYRILDVAKAARDAIAASTSGTQDATTQMACRWAAELLACTYHLSVDSIATLRIMDDALAVAVISAAIGLSCKAEAA